MPEVDPRTLLVITVALLTLYTAGIGGSTAAAIGAWDAWRRRDRGAVNLDPRRGEVVLVAPSLPRIARWLRIAGWIAFVPALVLALFADFSYPWLAPTDFMGAHIGPFRGIRMSEGSEWQDPKTVPNVIFYRLNRALVRPRKSPLSRLTGMTYFDGVIRNRFGVTTQELMQAMRTCHRLALEEERSRLRRPPQNEPAIPNPDA